MPRLYRIYLTESDEDGNFREDVPPSTIDVMEIERTREEAQQCWYAAARVADSQTATLFERVCDIMKRGV